MSNSLNEAETRADYIAPMLVDALAYIRCAMEPLTREERAA
jgi:hypothetical protein